KAIVTSDISETNTTNNSKEVSINVKPREHWTVAWFPGFYDPDPIPVANTCKEDVSYSCQTDSDCAEVAGGPGGGCWQIYSGANFPDVTRANNASFFIKHLFPLEITYQRQAGLFPWSNKTQGDFAFLCKEDCGDIRIGVNRGKMRTSLEQFRLMTKPMPDSLVAWQPEGAAVDNGCAGQASLPHGNDPRGGGIWLSQCPTHIEVLDQYFLAHEVMHNHKIDHPEGRPPPYPATPFEQCWPFPQQSADDEAFNDVKEVGVLFGMIPAFVKLLLDIPDTFVNPIPEDRLVLSSGAGNERWISPYLWNRLLRVPFGPEWSSCDTSQPPPGGGSWGPAEGNVISGDLDEEGNAVLDPIFSFETEGFLPSLDPTAPYCLEFEDAGGANLLSHCFDLPLGRDVNGANQPGSFTFLLPHPPATSRVILRHDGNVLTQRFASTNAPVIDVTSPVAGSAPITGPVTVTFLAEDPDGDELSFALLYSPDAGDSLYPIAVDTVVTSGTVDTTNLPGGTNALIRVLASDGFRTTAADSPYFAVARKHPVAIIESPGDGVRISASGHVLLSGFGDDLEDGLLNGSSLEWSSDQDGHLGSGAELLLWGSDLTLGTHEITLTAIDSDGLTGKASVMIAVALPIEIDIKPGSTTNPVNPVSRGVVPVAILGSESFDVTEVDVTTLAFGPDGALPWHHLNKAPGYRNHLEDANEDNRTDLIAHFPTQEAGLAPGYIEACLVGETLDGIPFTACDVVSIVNNRKP
ncbi:MAG: hypothetical protein PVI91_18060, partial [Gammaproteobacteria bacterium]